MSGPFTILMHPRFSSQLDDGSPNAGGLVYTYKAGTTDPLTTFSNPGLTAANTNPIVLDASGMCDLWVSGPYKVVVQDADGVTLFTRDNLFGFAGGNMASLPDQDEGKVLAWGATAGEFENSSMTIDAIEAAVNAVNQLLITQGGLVAADTGDTTTGTINSKLNVVGPLAKSTTTAANGAKAVVISMGNATGATATAAGTTGLESAPQAGDQDKVRHGDGSWDYPRPWRTLPRGSITRTSDSTFTVQDNAANQAVYAVRRPIRFRANSSVVWGAANYAFVINYAAGVVTIGGCPLTSAIAGDSGFEIQFGDMTRLLQVREFFQGLFSVNYGSTDQCFGSGGTPISGGYYSSLGPGYLFDGNTNSYWQSNTANAGWAGIQFPTAKTIAAYRILAGPIGAPLLPVSWTFEGSNDGVNWTPIDARADQTFGAYATPVYTCAAASYTHYRINVISTLGGSPTICGLEMYAAAPMNLFSKKYGHACRWFQSRAHLVRLAVRPRMDDSGATQPTVNVTIGGVPALTAALTVNDASFAASAATLDPVASALSAGSDIELTVTPGTNNDGIDLDVMMLFILE